MSQLWPPYHRQNVLGPYGSITYVPTRHGRVGAPLLCDAQESEHGPNAVQAAWTPEQPVTLPVRLALGHLCSVCAQSFASLKAKAVHEQTKHGISATARQFMPHGTQCRACLSDFHTTQRLRQHLQYEANGCLRHLTGVNQPLSAEEILTVPTVRQKGAGYRIPPLRLPGPRLPTREQWQRTCPNREMPPVPTAIGNSGCPIVCDVLDWLLNVVQWECPATWSWPSSIPRTPLAICGLGSCRCLVAAGLGS